jgi:hypothetical protein
MADQPSRRALARQPKTAARRRSAAARPSQAKRAAYGNASDKARDAPFAGRYFFFAGVAAATLISVAVIV